MAATKRLNKELQLKYSNNNGNTSRTNGNNPLEKLRSQCLCRGAAGIKGLGRVFKIMDDDGSRTLSLQELKKGLHDYGVDLSNEELMELFQQFDQNQSGNIDFQEFLEMLRPPMTKSRKKLVHEAYRKLDKNHDGNVTVDDLKGVYNVKKHPKYVSGEWSEDKCIKEFLDSFEVRGNHDGEVGQVTEDEFMSYYAGVSASVDNDAYFDLMMRNAWKL